MNYRNYTHYIVVDSNRKPMSFHDNQFVYNESDRHRRPFPVQLYTHKEAKDLIKKSTDYRLKNNFSPTKYMLMPVLTTNQ